MYKKDYPRKIRDKYDKMLKEIKADIESGNQSGKSGEMSDLYGLTKQILDDIDENDEDKEEAKKQKEASKKLLDDIEKKATSNRPNPLRDGTSRYSPSAASNSSKSRWKAILG